MTIFIAFGFNDLIVSGWQILQIFAQLLPKMFQFCIWTRAWEERKMVPQAKIIAIYKKHVKGMQYPDRTRLLG
jgi:hypothetical protein